MSTHLEIELNERQNLEGTGSENCVWQISADWLIRNNIRILGNYLFDKFVLDKEKKAGRERAWLCSFNDGYTDYLAGPFPSGDVETILFATGRLQWWWKQNLSLITEFEYNDSKRND